MCRRDGVIYMESVTRIKQFGGIDFVKCALNNYIANIMVHVSNTYVVLIGQLCSEMFLMWSVSVMCW